MKNIESAVSIWMRGGVDGEDLAALSALITDFERDLDIQLRVDEPTRLTSRLSLDSVTQVDLRSLLELPATEDPTLLWHRHQGQGESEEPWQTVPLKRSWLKPRESERDRHLHLIVESPRPRTDDLHEQVNLVVNLSRPPSKEVVIHIARAIKEVLGPECHIHPASPDEVYLQTLEELEQHQPQQVTAMWFAAGLAAERELALRPGTGPLPTLYADAEPSGRYDHEDDDEPVHRVRSRGQRWGILMLTVVAILLGLSFFRTNPIVRWIDHKLDLIVDSDTRD